MIVLVCFQRYLWGSRLSKGKTNKKPHSFNTNYREKLLKLLIIKNILNLKTSLIVAMMIIN
jgi:hypothetical protein